MKLWFYTYEVDTEYWPAGMEPQGGRKPPRWKTRKTEFRCSKDDPEFILDGVRLNDKHYYRNVRLCFVEAHTWEES